MSEFTAKVTAQLDTSKIPSQLAEIQAMAAKQKIKISVDASEVKSINQVTNAFNDLMKLQNRINSTRLKLSGLNPSKDTKQIQELSGQLNRLMSDYNRLNSTFSRSFSTNQIDALNRGFETTSNKIAALNAKASDTSGVQKTERAYVRLKEIVSQMGKIQVKIGSLDANKNTSEIAQLTSQFNNLSDQYNRLKASLSGKLSGVQVTELSRNAEALKNKLSQLDAKAQDTQRKLAETINVKMSNGSFESSISKVTAEYEKLASTGHSKLSEIRRDIESLTQIQQRMSSSTNSADLVSNYEKFNSTLQRIKNTLSTVSAESKTFASSLQMSKLDNKMASWLNKNSKAAKDYGASIQELRNQLATLMNSGEPVPVSAVNSIDKQFSAIQQSAISAGKTGATFASRLKGSLSSISSYLSTTTLIYTGIRGLKDMYKNVTNIDSAMVELKRVTNETDETYDRFLSGTNQRAQKIGTTITGLVSSTADFARLGYTFDESEKLAETANIYAVVGDEIADVDTATKSIISTMKAFNVPVEDSISIVDKFNEVGNNFAISSGGIGEAMERSASSMRAANNTIDETIALITAANTVVQDPDSVGTAFKTISMRIRGAKTELEDAGLETDGMVESTAKLREEIKALSGVDIMQDENTFKSTYKIMDELATKWSSLTDIQQASITELIAGKRQGNIVSSLMENFDEARRALEVSMNSEGSAMTEHEKWLDSVEAKQLQLKASWEGLSQDFLSSDFLKVAIDGLRSLVNILDSVVNKFGSIGTLLAGFLSFQGIKGLASIGKSLIDYGVTSTATNLLGDTVGNIIGNALGVTGKETVTKVASKVAKKTAGKTAENIVGDVVGEVAGEALGEGMVKTASGLLVPKAAAEIAGAGAAAEGAAAGATALSAALPAVVIGLAAVAAAAVTAKVAYDQWYKRNYLWADDFSEQSVKLQDASKDYTRLIKLKEEYAKAKAVVSSPVATTAEIDVAKSKIEEIKQLLEDEYNLKITSDTEDLDNAFQMLTARQRYKVLDEGNQAISDMYDAAEGYKSSQDKLNEYDTKMSDLQGKATALSNIRIEAQKLGDAWKHGAISEQEYNKQFSELKKNAFSEGLTDVPTEEAAQTRFSSTDDLVGWLNLEDSILTNEMKTVSEDYQQVIDQREKFKAAIEGSNEAFSELLANDIQSGNTENIDYDTHKLLEIGRTAKDSGLSTDELARSFATAKTGYTEFVDAINNGKAQEVAQNFIDYKKSIGDFADSENEVISQAALIRNGFSKVTPELQKNSESIKAVIKDMQVLGQSEGINYSSEQLTDMAHALDLIPETKHIEFDVNTGEISIVDDLAEKIKSFNKISNSEIHLKVNDDGTIGVLDTVDTKLKELIAQGADIRVNFNTETGGIELFNGTEKIGTVTAEGKIQWEDTTPPKPEEPEPITYPTEVEEPEPVTPPEPEPITYPTEVAQPEPAPAPQPEPVTQPVTPEPTGEPEFSDTTVNVTPSVSEIPSVPDSTTNVTPVVSSVPSVPDANANVNFGVGSSPSTVPNASGTADFGLGQHPTSAPDIPGQANYSGNFPTSAPTLFGTIIYTVKTIGAKIKNAVTGGGGVDGTAHAGGTAFAKGTTGKAFKSGNWGTKNSGIALGGELGEELVVRNGKFFTIGSESAEMFSYQKGDIIFNAEQTKQIFEKGKITHGTRRGKAFNSGTAFAEGSESKEHFDWIETFSGRVERNIDRFTNKFKSTYLTLVNRFTNLGNALSETKNQIGFKQQAYDRYMEQANAVGLDESWAAKVRDGEFDISTVTDDSLKEKIKDYQNWYEKALDCKDAIDDLHKSVADLYKENFDNIESAYDNILTSIEHKANMLNEYVDRAEEKGLVGSTRYYTALQKVEMENMAQLKHKQTDLVNALNEAINSGEIEVYSEAWYELQGSIDEVTESIEKSKTALIKFDNQMRQVAWDRFDYMQEGLTQLTGESEFLIKLLSNRDLYNTTDSEVKNIISLMQGNSSRWHSASATGKDSLERQNRNYARRIANMTEKNVEIDDDGVWWIDNQQLYSLNNDNYGGLSDAGMSILGLHGLNYNVYMEQSKAYANELADIDKQLAESPYDTNLIERKQELLKLQRESILAAEDEKQAMIDLIKDGIEQQVDALKDLIDAYIESLDSAKDLYDYQKKIKNHTKDIASLEKQLAAYQNDASEETKAKIQQIKVELEEARENLQDTEYDKYISDQKELLDNLYDEYESLMNERLDNIDVSIDKLVSEVNNNASTINATLTKETTKVGTTLSSEMKAVWTSESQALTTYFGDTGIILNGVSGYFENTNTTLSGINTALTSILTGVNSIVQYASFQAKVDIDPEGSKNQMMQNSMDWWATDDENVRSSLAAENEKYGEAFGYTKNDGSWYDSDGNLAYEVTNDDNIRNIVSKMKANSEAWHGASDSKRAELSSANENYAKKIQSLTDQPVYKDGNGVWWIGDRELYAYKSGGLADFTGTAWLDGTPSKPEMVLNAKDTENFIALKDTLKHMSEQGLSLANVGYGNIGVPQLSGLTDISSILHTLRQSNNSSGGNTIGDIEINIPIEHVDDYNDFITQLQKDKQFEKFIRSVSVDLLSGGSTLAKNKYKW